MSTPPNSRQRKSHEAGFGIVEVIAALLILSLCLVPLMDITQSLVSQSRAIEDRQNRAEKIQNALAYFRNYNVGEELNHSRDFGDWSVAWEARLVSDKHTFYQNTAGGTTRHYGLFVVDITLSYRLDAVVRQATYTTRSVGWSEGEKRNRWLAQTDGEASAL